MLAIGLIFSFGFGMGMLVAGLILEYRSCFKMGTVEPIFKKKYDASKEIHLIAFVRGFVMKYKNTAISKKEIFNYLSNLIK